MGLARKVASSHTDPVCLLQSGLQYDITSQLLPIIGDEKPCDVFLCDLYFVPVQPGIHPGGSRGQGWGTVGLGYEGGRGQRAGQCPVLSV